MNKVSFIIVFILLIGGAHLPAQDEGGMRGVGRLNAPEAVAEGRNLLFVVGIDDYPNWFKLNNAVSDARGVQDVFMEQFGFEPVVAPLFNKEATRDNIKSSLDLMRRRLQADDKLVIFYAGHGETRRDSLAGKVIESGYIIPVDGAPLEEQRWSSYLSIQELLAEVARLPARHITLILDACHSGIALGDAATQMRGSTAAPPASIVNKVSRRVITSARSDQLASDKGPVGDHSLFTGMLVQGLRLGAADLDKDGLIATTELGFYLQQSVSRYSGDLQTPDFGTFTFDDRGDMILPVEAATPARLMSMAHSQWRNARISEFRETFRKLEAVDSTSIEYWYLKMIHSLLEPDLDAALRALEERALREPEQLGEENKTLMVTARRSIYEGLRQWKPFLEAENEYDERAIQVELLLAGAAQPFATETRGAFRFELHPGDTYTFRFTNGQSHPLFIYALYLDPIVRIRPVGLWNNRELMGETGLLPGQSAETRPFTQVGVEGLEAFRFIFSKEPLEAFLNPPDVLMEMGSLPAYDGELGIQTAWVVFR